MAKSCCNGTCKKKKPADQDTNRVPLPPANSLTDAIKKAAVERFNK